MINIKDINCKDCIVQPICRQRGAEAKLIHIYSQLKELLFLISETSAYRFEKPMGEFHYLLTKLVRR